MSHSLEMFSSHSSNSSSSSSTSSSSRTNSSNTSSDMTTKSTPLKGGAATMKISTVDDMKSALKVDLTGHVYNAVTVEDFVKYVWSLDAKTVEDITAANLELHPDALQRYSNVFTPGKPTVEPNLHAPFIEISADLLVKVCKALKLSIDEAIQDGFWNGNGSEILKSLFNLRKPDLLRLWLPILERMKCRWSEVKSVLEFKLRQTKQEQAKAKSEELKQASTEQSEGAVEGGTSEATVNNSSPQTPVKKKPPRRGKKGKAPLLEVIKEAEEGVGGSASSIKDVLPSLHETAGPAHVTNADIKSDSSSNATSFKTNSGGSKRTIDTVDDPEEPASKRRNVKIISKDQMQLANYALECLGTSSRHYTTGIFVDGTRMSLWYYDRVAVIHSVTFDFDAPGGATSLALILFALSQANMKQAGFDPFVHQLVKPADNAPVTESCIKRLERPAADGHGLCLRFPQLGEREELIFSIDKTLYTYRGIVGRGTTVAKGTRVKINEAVSDVEYTLKMSWQYKVRTHEAEIINTLRARLPPHWHKYLPEPTFSAIYSSEELGLPRTTMKGILTEPHPETPIQDRDLHILMSGLYHHLWDAKDVDEFKRIFVDCLECHYHAYTTGQVLHRDISENNLMFWRPKASQEGTGNGAAGKKKEEDSRGILNDFDMAAFVHNEGEEHISTAHHRTGTLPFMALDLLNPYDFNPIHYYRHDLESLFYILIWAATHYTFKGEGNKRRLDKSPRSIRKWNSKRDAYHAKLAIYGRRGLVGIDMDVRPPFKELWKSWIEPLFYGMFRPVLNSIPDMLEPSFATYNFETCNGQITFHKFMDLIKVTPRELNPVGS